MDSLRLSGIEALLENLAVCGIGIVLVGHFGLLRVVSSCVYEVELLTSYTPRQDCSQTSRAVVDRGESGSCELGTLRALNL
jgi:hypothetical protein